MPSPSPWPAADATSGSLHSAPPSPRSRHPSSPASVCIPLSQPTPTPPAASQPNVTIGCSAATGSTPSTQRFPTAPTQPTFSHSQAQPHSHERWPPPDPPTTGTTTAAPSACGSVYRWRRSATPCSHSSNSGTPTRAEPRDNPCRPSARSNTEYQPPPPQARLSSEGLPSPARQTPEHFHRTGPDRRQPHQDDQLGPLSVDANYHHQYVRHYRQQSCRAGLYAEYRLTGG